MIRTALTLGISAQDAQNISFLANSTHLGLLSSTAQNIHVQTNNRSLQLIVSIRCENPGDSLCMSRQRQQITAWQTFYQLLVRRGTTELNSLILQYHLCPDRLVCMDEQRLQAWLPADSGFYLLRHNEMRRLRPTVPRDPQQAAAAATIAGEGPNEAKQYYMLNIQAGDHFCLLPPQMLTYFKSGEVTDLLLGLRQLPDKLRDLQNIARQRGYSDDQTWLAIQILRLEEDRAPDGSRIVRDYEPVIKKRKRFSKSSKGEDLNTDSDSLSAQELAEGSEAQSDKPSSRPWFSKRLFWLVGGGILLAIIVVLVLILGRPPAGEPLDTSTAQTTSTAAATPTPTIRPTQATTTTVALPRLTVIAHQLNLREAPDRNSAQLKKLETGEVLYQLEEPDGDWVKVKTEDGIVGYVFNIYVEPANP